MRPPPRIAVVYQDYPAFLGWHYRNSPGLGRRSFAEQLAARNGSLFGTADFYSRNLRALGAPAAEFYFNNYPLQLRWVAEHPEVCRPSLRRQAALGSTFVGAGARAWDRLGGRLLRRWWSRLGYEVLAAQLRAFAPTVVLNGDMNGLRTPVLRRVVPPGARFLGEADASFAFDPQGGYEAYELVRCSLRRHLSHFRRAVHYRFAFEHTIRDAVPAGVRDIPLAFVGHVGGLHRQRTEVLEAIARELPLAWWGPGVDTLAADSPLRACYRGPAWGRQMYEVLARAAVVVNRQIDRAEDEVDNMRMYEATGMGCLLLTDLAPQEASLFESGREVLMYASPAEAVQAAREVLADPARLARIAAAGQARTLREHTYAARMREFLDVLEESPAVPAPA